MLGKKTRRRKRRDLPTGIQELWQLQIESGRGHVANSREEITWPTGCVANQQTQCVPAWCLVTLGSHEG